MSRVMEGRSLREVEKETRDLQQENFDLKMRLFNVEERLHSLTHGGVGDPSTLGTEEIRAEHAQQRLLLQEKTAEVEERDALLIKARKAIEELQRSHQEIRSEHHSTSAMAMSERAELERRISQLEHDATIHASDMQSLKGQLDAAQQERNNVEDQKALLQQSLAELQIAQTEEAVKHAEKVSKQGSDLETMRHDLNEAKQYAEASKQHATGLSAKCDQLVDEQVKDKERLRKAEKSVKALQRENKEVLARAESVTRAAAAVAQELEATRAALKAKEDEAQVASVEAGELKNQSDGDARLIQSLRTECTQLRSRQETDANEAAQLVVELEEARRELANQQSSNKVATEELMRQVASLTSANTELKDRLSSRQNLDDDLRQETVELRASLRDAEARAADNEQVKAHAAALQSKQLELETELSRTAQVLGVAPSVVGGTLDQRILGITEAAAQMPLLQKQVAAEELRADKATAAFESASKELEDTKSKLLAEQHSRASGERQANSEAATALDHVRAELDEARRSLLAMERQEDDFRTKIKKMESEIEEQRRVIAEHDRNVMSIRTDFEVRSKAVREEADNRVSRSEAEFGQRLEAAKRELVLERERERKDMKEQIQRAQGESEAMAQKVAERDAQYRGLQDTIQEGKYQVDNERHCRERAEASLAAVEERVKSAEARLTSTHGELSAVKEERDVLARAAGAAALTMRQLERSVPVYVDDVMSGLRSAAADGGAAGGLSGHSAFGTSPGAHAHDPFSRDGSSGVTADTTGSPPKIDYIAQLCASHITEPLRKLHSLRQAFQEATQRMKAHFDQKEQQQTLQLNDMSRRLAIAGAAVSHARAAVEAKVATQTAAVESEYRRQNDLLRAQLHEMEMEGRKAALEAETQAAAAAQATEDLRNQQQRMAEMQDALTTELRNLREREEKHLGEIAAHKQVGAASEAQTKAMAAQLHEQTAALKEAKEEIKRMTTVHQELSTSHNETKERHDDVGRQLSLLESRHKDLNSEHELTKRRLADEKAKVAERDNQISATVAQLSAAAVGTSVGGAKESVNAEANQHVAQMVARLEQILKGAEQLVHEARALATGRKESFMMSSGNHDEEGLRSDDTYSLLDANVRLTQQVQQLTIDLQQFARTGELEGQGIAGTMPTQQELYASPQSAMASPQSAIPTAQYGGSIAGTPPDPAMMASPASTYLRRGTDVSVSGGASSVSGRGRLGSSRNVLSNQSGSVGGSTSGAGPPQAGEGYSTRSDRSVGEPNQTYGSRKQSIHSATVRSNWDQLKQKSRKSRLFSSPRALTDGATSSTGGRRQSSTVGSDLQDIANRLDQFHRH